MTVKGGTNHACAVCKYQRRKCTAECPLAPYFPADQPRQFQNAHRLFGVSNILKILDKVEASSKPEAMRSILVEANLRDRYPVHGCLGIIYALRIQIHHAQLELESLHHHLTMLRQQQNLPAASSSASNEHYNVSENNGFISFDGISVDGCGVRKNVDMIWTPFAADGAPNYAAQTGIMQQEYDEISPYFDVLDEDRRPYEDSKEACNDSCSDLIMGKEVTEQRAECVTENELKSAAACFTLTSAMN